MDDKYIVFLDWDVAVKINDYDTSFMNTYDYLKGLEEKLDGDNNNVFFGFNKKRFIITEDGIDYEVILPRDSEKSLYNKKYTSLVVNLFYLSIQDSKFEDNLYLKASLESKVEKLDNTSYYGDFSVGELNYYLCVLKNRLQNNEDVKTNKTRMSEVILAMEGMKPGSKSCSEIYDIIHNLMEESIKLSSDDQRKALDMAEKILNTFTNYKKQYKGTLYEDELPEEIVNQINELKLFINKPQEEVDDNYADKICDLLHRIEKDQEDEKVVGGK